MDVCTLIVITTMNTQACGAAERCSIKNNIKYCFPAHAIQCPIPEPTYDCVKADGTKYTIKQSEVK